MRSMVGILSLLLLVFFAAALTASQDLPPSLLVAVPGDQRPEVENILANPTFVRGLDFAAFADLQVYTYLLDHPDLNAALAQALGIAHYKVVRLGPGHDRGTDGNGNVGTIEVFRDEGHERAFLEQGVSSGWWFGDIGGRVVALIVFAPEAEGVRGTVTVWARIDQGLVDHLLRRLKPMLGGFLDRKLREQFDIPTRVAEAAAQHPNQFCSHLWAVSEGSSDERQALGGLAGCWRAEPGRRQPLAGSVRANRRAVCEAPPVAGES